MQLLGAFLCGLSGLTHFILELRHRADAEANCLCDSIDANALGEFGSRLAQLVGIGIRTTEALFDLAVLRDEVSVTFDLILGAQPALTRVRIIERSNSVNAPVIWNMSLPAGVVVSIAC